MPLDDKDQSRDKPKTTREFWLGVLDAACQSKLLIGDTGRVIVVLSNAKHSQTDEAKRQRADLSTWGKVESKECSVPFRKSEGCISPADIRLELISASQFLNCPKRIVDMDLNWDDTQRDVRFQVQPTSAGDHAIDILLLVRKKQVAQVSLVAMADSKESSEDDYERLAELRVVVHVGRYLSKERALSIEEGLSRPIDRDIQKNKDRSLGNEYDSGISM